MAFKEINEAQEVLQDATKRTSYDLKYKQNQAEFEKQQKIAGEQELINKIKAEIQRQKSNSANGKSLIDKAEFFWDGTGSKELQPEQYETFDKFSNRFKEKYPKGKCEKTVVYEERIGKLMMNSYFGEQNTRLYYDADDEIFIISMNETLFFELPVSIDIAPYFDVNVLKFTVAFSKNLKIVEIFVEFNNQKFQGQWFNSDWLVEIDKIKKNAKQKEFNRLSDPDRIIKFKDKQLVWIDITTNLMWEVKTKQNRNDRYTWQQAKDYANSLNGQKYGGFDNWRLPTKEEAISLSRFYYGTFDSNSSLWFVNNKKHHILNANNLGTFIKKPLSFVIGGCCIWTSTIRSESDKQSSWVVDFNFGDDSWDYQTNNQVALCVRDHK